MFKLLVFKRRTWIVFILSFIASFIMAISANAQDAAKYGITFPVSELGSCADYSSCRTFCEDPLNQNACINFAKKKGFYREPEVAGSKKEQIIGIAKKELGCDSES